MVINPTESSWLLKGHSLGAPSVRMVYTHDTSRIRNARRSTKQTEPLGLLAWRLPTPQVPFGLDWLDYLVGMFRATALVLVIEHPRFGGLIFTREGQVQGQQNLEANRLHITLRRTLQPCLTIPRKPNIALPIITLQLQVERRLQSISNSVFIMAQFDEEQIKWITSSVLLCLAGTPYECSSLTRLDGGPANLVYHGALASPVSSSSETLETVIVKHTPDFPVCNPDFTVGRSRGVIFPLPPNPGVCMQRTDISPACRSEYPPGPRWGPFQNAPSSLPRQIQHHTSPPSLFRAAPACINPLLILPRH